MYVLLNVSSVAKPIVYSKTVLAYVHFVDIILPTKVAAYFVLN